MSTDASRWYVGGPDKKPYGPYDFSRLRDYVKEGKIKPDSFLLREGSNEWVPAASSPDLFVISRADEPPALPPANTTPPSKPVTAINNSCSSGVLYVTFVSAMVLCAAGLLLYGLFQLLAGSTVVMARDSQLLGIAAITLIMTMLQLIVMVQAANTLRRIERQRR